MPNLFFDVSITIRYGFNTGIQRVVLNLGESLSAKNSGSRYKINVVTHVIGEKNRFECLTTRDLRMLKSQRAGGHNPMVKIKLKIFQVLRIFKFLGPAVNRFASVSMLKELFIFQLSRKYPHNKGKHTRKTCQISEGDVYITADTYWNSSYDSSVIHEAHSLGAEVFIIVHDIFPLTHPQFFDESSIKLFRENFPKPLSYATKIFCFSNYVQNELATNFPNLKNIEVIPMGLEKQTTTQSDHLERSPSEKVRLLMVGTLEPRKNYDQILDWLEITKLNVHLDIVGRKGWKSEQLAKRILSFRDNKYRSLEWHKNLSDADLEILYRSADIGICASRIEGFGIPLRDFLTRNLMVVASDIPPFKEIEARTKIEYFELDLNSSFNEAILKCIQANNRRVERERTGQFYTWDEVAERLIQSVLENYK